MHLFWKCTHPIAFAFLSLFCICVAFFSLFWDLHFYPMKMHACSRGSMAAHKNKQHSLNAFILKMHPSNSICSFVTFCIFVAFFSLFWDLHFYLMKMHACSMGSMAAHKNKKHSLNAFILKIHTSNSICIFICFLHFYRMKMYGFYHLTLRTRWKSPR